MRSLAIASCLVLLAASPTRAQDASAGDTPWQFSFAPYVWATALQGTLDTEGLSADIDVSFSDILNTLDAGFLANAEARKGRFSFTTNVIYMRMNDQASKPVSPLLPNAPPGDFEVRAAMDTAIVELRPAFEVLALPLFGEGDPREIALDLGPVARVWWLDQHAHVKLDSGSPLGPYGQRFDESTDWVDFGAAARVRAQLSESLGLVISGDYGGFDLGSSSHRTWSLAGFFAYSLGEHWQLGAGWRELEIDRGALNLEMSGPLVGAIYRF